MSGNGFTTGVGFTLIVNDRVLPTQLFADGVTVIVAIITVSAVLTAVNDPILPVPLAARPMEALLFVHANEVPVTPPVKVTASVGVALHLTWLAIVAT